MNATEAQAAYFAENGIIPLALTLPPYTSASLTANLVFRVLLGIIANLVCLVPLRILYRNGELAAVVFITNLELKNIHTIVMALIWHNDDMQNWWLGRGLCDFSSFYYNGCIALFVTSLLAIIRNLAYQVGLMRANPLTVREKRRRNLIQVLIMVPLPLVQLGLTWVLSSQRYAIGTLIGCSWVGYASWQYVIFFIIAPLLVSTLTVGYSILTYSRFREVAKSTDAAVSSNRVANHRAQRARRRLYLMVISIMAPFYPITLAITAFNIIDMQGVKPYNYDVIHGGAYSDSWNDIIYLPSTAISFSLMNISWIPILTGIPVFVFFGMTKDAMNDYRKALLFMGVGPLFPRLYEEYDPDRPEWRNGSYSSSGFTSQTGSTNPKHSIVTSSHPRATLTCNPPSGDTGSQLQSLNFVTSYYQEIGQDPSAIQVPKASYDKTIHRNPFVFRTMSNLPISFKFPWSRSQAHDNEFQPAAHTAQTNLNQPQNGSRSGPNSQPWSEADSSRPLCTTTTTIDHDTDDDEIRSVSSDHNAQGVRVKTMFTRETRETLHERWPRRDTPPPRCGKCGCRIQHSSLPEKIG